MTGKQWAVLGTKLAFSGLLVWIVIRHVPFSEVLGSLRTIDTRWLVVIAAIGPVSVVLSAWRWKWLSLGLIPLGEAIRYTWIGLFFSTIVPGVVGGDIAKGVSLAAKDPNTRDPRLPVSIAVDKIVGFWVLLAMFDAVSLFLLKAQPTLLLQLRSVIWIILAATALGLIAGIAAFHRTSAVWGRSLADKIPVAPLRSAAVKLLESISLYHGQTAILMRSVAMSVVMHALTSVSFWLLMRALAIPASLGFAAVFYSLLSVVLVIPVSVSGVGVRDVAAAGIFTAFGLKAPAGVAFSWAILLVSLPNVLIGGLIQIWELFHRARAKQAEDASRGP